MRLDRKVARIYNPNKGTWQADCYRHFRICGEASYAASFMGNAISRAVLSALDADGKPTKTGPAADLLDQLFNGASGQSQMLNEIGTHLTIAGECYLVGREVGGVDIWEIVSVLEIEVIGTRWKLKFGTDGQDIELNDKDVVIRIWTPLPGNRMEANSPFRSLLPILTEIEWLTSHVFSQIRSRLLTAGILFLPENMTFPPPPDVNGKAQEVANEAEAFMKMLAAGMERALKREGHPDEIVPTVVIAPGETIGQTKLMEFWSQLDSEAKELRSEAIRRFATGMNLPAEEILGMSSNGGTGGGTSNGISHWGAWQIEESTIKMHVEPMLDVIVNAITIGYLRPQLPAGATDRIGYDTSALKLRPDRSAESLELYDRGLVKAEVPVRENGFDPTADMPTNSELVIWLLRKVASGSTTPEQVAQALTALGVEGMEPVETPTDVVPTEERPTPSLEEHPTRPRTPQESALLYACDALVLRALELAGKRAINAGLRGKNRDTVIEPTEFHLHKKVEDCAPLLDGVFSHGHRVFGPTWDRLAGPLADYCAALIETQTPHTRENLQGFLLNRGISDNPQFAQQPINLTVNVNGQEQPITLALPDNLVNVAMPDIRFPDITLPEIRLPEINLPEVKLAPQIRVEQPTINNPAPIVNVTNDVQTPTVNVTNDVQTPNVNVTNEVATPEVNVDVAAPAVTVNPKVTADVKMPPAKPKKTKVIYNDDGSIAGTEEVK